MKDRVVTPVYFISSVYVRSDRISLTRIGPENVGFMGASMRPQHSVFVDVVCVRAASTRMILREAKRIKVLRYGDDWMQIIVVSIDRLTKASLDELAGYGQWM